MSYTKNTSRAKFNKAKFDKARNADYGDGEIGGCDESIEACNKKMEGVCVSHNDTKTDCK